MKENHQSRREINPPNWRRLVEELNSFVSVPPSKKELISNRRVDLKLIATLHGFFPLMALFACTLDDRIYMERYGRWYYETILKEPFPFDKNVLELSRDFPSLKTIYQGFPPKSIQLLETFYEKLKSASIYSKAFKHYSGAVKEGLLGDVWSQAALLSRHLERYSNFEEFYKKASSLDSFSRIKEFISLAKLALDPIAEWSFFAKDRNEAVSYLSKIGNSLNPVRRGKERRMPFLYEMMLYILYHVLLEEFKEANKIRAVNSKIVQLEEGIAGLISSKVDWSFTARPNEAAKRVLNRVFKVNEGELARIVSKKNEKSFFNKIKSLKENRENLEHIYKILQQEQ